MVDHTGHELLTVAEVAERCCIQVGTVRRWIRELKVEAVRPCDGSRALRVSMAEVDAMMKTETLPSALYTAGERVEAERKMYLVFAFEAARQGMKDLAESLEAISRDLHDVQAKTNNLYRLRYGMTPRYGVVVPIGGDE